MNKLIYTVFLILTLTLTVALIPTESEAQIYTDTVRLHILANSDSEFDQALKLDVRNFVLEKYSQKLSNFKSTEAAVSAIQDLIPSIEADINEYLLSRGVAYFCTVEIGEEWYDTRKYENFTMPRGVYYSLRIMLGGAEGKNWWCVMYPPMCLDLATENAPRDDGILDYTKEEITLITRGDYSIKFKLLELVSGAIREVSKNG